MDLAWRLRTQGYDATLHDRRARRGGLDFHTRLLGRPAWVLGSQEGARAFYDESLAARAGVVPPPLAWLLFGRGAVHGLDGSAHRERKLLMMDILSADGLTPLVEGAEELLRQQVATWNGQLVDVHAELVAAYGLAALRWAGIGLPAATGTEVSRCLASIVDGFGFSGSAYLRAWRARMRANRWARVLIGRVRSREVEAPDGSALAVLAASDLDDATAGVELLNVLRPTVAVAWLGAFAAVRIEQEPQWRERLVDGDPHVLRAFAQEVRRTAPFVPALAARAVRDARIGDCALRRGDLLVLDVIGIHHDPVRWPDPDAFAPQRFLGREPGAFDLVPQGGGHPAGHRCPGEPSTLRLLAMTVHVLAETDFQVCDASADRSRIPTLPGGVPRLARVYSLPRPAAQEGPAA